MAPQFTICYANNQGNEVASAVLAKILLGDNVKTFSIAQLIENPDDHKYWTSKVRDTIVIMLGTYATPAALEKLLSDEYGCKTIYVFSFSESEKTGAIDEIKKAGVIYPDEELGIHGPVSAMLYEIERYLDGGFSDLQTALLTNVSDAVLLFDSKVRSVPKELKARSEFLNTAIHSKISSDMTIDVIIRKLFLGEPGYTVCELVKEGELLVANHLQVACERATKNAKICVIQGHKALVTVATEFVMLTGNALLEKDGISVGVVIRPRLGNDEIGYTFFTDDTVNATEFVIPYGGGGSKTCSGITRHTTIPWAVNFPKKGDLKTVAFPPCFGIQKND